VVSLPVIAHYAASVAASRSDSRWKKRAIRAEAKLVPAQDDAAEALARITIPEDVMSKIAESLSPGSSIVVSDQGIAGGETGQGTDFIVTLR
jgi:hypothetical protein